MRKQSEPIPTWRFMGNPSISSPDGAMIGPIGKKPLALLAYLALTGEWISRDEVARMLWPDPDTARSKHNLRQCLLSLKKSFGEGFDECFNVSGQDLALNHDAVRIDALELLRIDSGRETSADEVIDLCRGPFLRGLTTRAEPFDEWLTTERERLQAATFRVTSAAHDSARKAGQTSRAAELRTILDALPGTADDQEGVRNWGLLAKVVSEQTSSRLRKFGMIFGIAALVLLALFGTYRASEDIQKFIDTIIDGQMESPPRIAVLPFTARNMTIEEQSLAGGVTRGVNFALYTITARDLFVVTHVARAKDLDASERLQLAEDLGVQYLISGSVEVEGETVRVYVQCLDAQTRSVIWREQFDKPVVRAFKLQDEITLEVLQGLDIDLTTAEWNRIQYLDDTDNLHAWLAATNGVRHLIRVRKKNVEIARQSYMKALEYDPDYTSAHRGLGWVSYLNVRLGWASERDAELQKAKDELGIVLRKKPEDGLGKALEGAILLLDGDNYESAIDAGEFALEQMPGSATVTAMLAHNLTYVGQSERALDLMDRAMELSSRSPDWYIWLRGRALRLSGQVQESVQILEQGLKSEPSLVHLVELASSYSAVGNNNAARRIAKKIQLIKNNDFSASEWLSHPRIQNPEVQSLEFENLSNAGL